MLSVEPISQAGFHRLPACWSGWCAREFEKAYFQELTRFLAGERARYTVFPPAEQTFAAFQHTAYDRVRVLLLGQDPYHQAGQAHGLCFSVPPGVPPPPSLRNILKELHDDLGCPAPDHGCLSSWARQGVLLLNTVLTVRAHQAHSHGGKGWETFTDAVIRRVNEKSHPVVFVLWGKPAQKKLALIDQDRHHVVQSPHPSPLSAHRGFHGSRPFSRINEHLRVGHLPPIDWNLTKSGT